MKIFLILFLIGCTKYPCRTVVDVEFSGSEKATAIKYVKCGEISLPYPTKNKQVSFIEVHFFQGARVVAADVVFGNEFKDSIFNRQYEFYDTNPDVMIWKVYDENRAGYVQYSTQIK